MGLHWLKPKKKKKEDPFEGIEDHAFEDYAEDYDRR